MESRGSMPHLQGPCVKFLNENDFYSVKLLASRQTPKLEDHSWSAVHDCLFNIFAAPSTTQGTRHAMVTGTHGWNTMSILPKL